MLVARTVLINLAVGAVAALVALAGLELYLRLTVPASSGGSIYRFTLDTPRYKLMKPDAEIVAWGKKLRTNSLGFRDQPVAPKRAGEFRIVVLGDSFTVSAGVDYADMYTTRLRERLQARRPDVTLVNLAVGGYNIVQHELVLREVGLALAPDLILVALFPENDFALDTYEGNYRVAAGLQGEDPPQAWHEELYVWRAYLSKAAGWLRRRIEPAAAIAAGGRDEGWERNAAALRAIAALARERDIDIAAVLLPHTWHFERQGGKFARVEALCADAGLRCLNLLEAFRSQAIPESALRLNVLDSHPNERYNAFVAERLAPWLGALVDQPRLRAIRNAPAQR